MLPVAAGMALAETRKGTGAVTVCFLGDGTLGEGVVYEAANLAAKWHLPVLFVLENNGYSEYTPLSKHFAGSDFACRAQGYGFPGMHLDGNDIFAVSEAVQAAAARARAGEGPTLLECMTYRYRNHCEVQPPEAFRDPAEIEQWQAKDPIARMRAQLMQRGIPFEPLDNGILSCEDPRRVQAICDGLSAAKIEAFAHKWLRRLPHPFTAQDQRAGYRYALSILQAEFSLTQVLDRPVTGRVFFEEVIRENLDVGRPDQVQLIFDRRVTRRTPGRFRTRVLTDGVVPSLHVDYKHSRIKQYYKEGRALRTETTINDTRDFAIGRGLTNLSALRKVGFQANRRLLDVQRLSHDCAIGEETVERVHRPVRVDGQRVPALRFLDPRVLALFCALVLFRLLPEGFTARDLRQHVAPLLGLAPDALSPGRVTYDLRRLRLHGLIERQPKHHRYRVTDAGLRLALFLPRVWARTVRPGLAIVMPEIAPNDGALRRAFERLEQAMDESCAQAKVAA